MKNFSSLILLLLTMTTSIQTVHAQETPPPAEPESGGVVCEPGVYLAEPVDCQVLGPSSYLTDLARLGMTFPPRPLPASKPDPSLTQLPYYYFHVKDGEYASIYSTPGGGGAGQQLPPGFVYISYIDRVQTDAVYYLMKNGGWVLG